MLGICIVRSCLSLMLVANSAAGAVQENSQNSALDEILDRAGDSIELLWQQMSSVTCTESVTQEKLGNHGNAEYKRSSIFDYLILINTEGNDVIVEESRLLQKDSKKSKDLPLLTTKGFPTLALIFHPLYRNSYSFRPDGEEMVERKRAIRVRFDHIPGTRATSALELAGKTYPLELQGKGWIDPDSGAILKVEADLAAPMEDLNLKGLHSIVTYRPQHFSVAPDVWWLPDSAVIRLETARQNWQNIHRFTNYKQFSVKEKRDTR